MPTKGSVKNAFVLKPVRPFGEREGKFRAPEGYVVYHGTHAKNVKKIMEKGLRGRNISGSNVVCFTEELEVTEDYGNATIAADLSGLEIERFWDEGEEDGVWEVQAEGPIPPERLSVVPQSWR